MDVDHCSSFVKELTDTGSEKYLEVLWQSMYECSLTKTWLLWFPESNDIQLLDNEMLPPFLRQNRARYPSARV